MGLFGNARHPLRQQVLDAFGGQPFRRRLYARIRWALTPFGEVAGVLPERGLCVDMGCGAGLFALAAAAARPHMTVLGVDIDERRIRAAEAAAQGNPRLSFVCTDWTTLPVDQADAFVFIDVLHHVPESQQREVIACSAERLSPGGLILIKDVGLRPRWKYVCNYLFDLTTALLHVTLGEARSYHAPGWWAGVGGQLGLDCREIPLTHWDYAPHYLVALRRSDPAGQA